jgi:hypothetical protein
MLIPNVGYQPRNELSSVSTIHPPSPSSSFYYVNIALMNFYVFLIRQKHIMERCEIMRGDLLCGCCPSAHTVSGTIRVWRPEQATS